MLTLRPALAGLTAGLLLVLAFSFPARSAPLCSGTTTVAALGATGCTFENLTFSNFELTGFRLPAAGLSALEFFAPEDILVRVVNTPLPINFVERIPGIGLVLLPADPDYWVAGPGFPAGFEFDLSYVITATGASFDRYQIRGAGNGSSLTSGAWRAQLDVDRGDGLQTTSNRGPFGEIGTVDPNLARIHVTSSAAATSEPGGGSAFMTAMTSVFTLGPAPVPAPGTLTLALVALAGLAARRRTQRG